MIRPFGAEPVRSGRGDDVDRRARPDLARSAVQAESAGDAGPIRPFGADEPGAMETGDPRAHGRLA